MDALKNELSLPDLKMLNDSLKKCYGYNFNNYALSSFKRRVARFMQLEKIKDTQELIQKVVENDKLYGRFLEEITVNTTEMFRFPSMWKLLRNEVLPALKYKKNIRIWHVGCSSGEEVYSMSILIKELSLDSNVSAVATDINEEVIQSAKKGVYSSRNIETHRTNYSASGGLSELSHYYKLSDDGAKFKMDDALLKNVKFYKHNLIVDSNFGKFDLILCRNVLIYFDKILQEQVFQMLLKSLNPSGFLVLGSKESMIWSATSDKYNIVNNNCKVFRLKDSNV